MRCLYIKAKVINMVMLIESSKIKKKNKRNVNVQIKLELPDDIAMVHVKYLKKVSENLISYIVDIGDVNYNHAGIFYINPDNKKEYILDLNTSIYKIPHSIVFIIQPGMYVPPKIYPKNKNLVHFETEDFKILKDGYIGIEYKCWSPVLTLGVLYVYWSHFLYVNK